MDGEGQRLPRKQIGRGFGGDFECENPGGPLIMDFKGRVEAEVESGVWGRWVDCGRAHVSWSWAVIVSALNRFQGANI